MRRTLAILLLVSWGVTVTGQVYTIKNKRAIKQYEMGKNAYELYEFADAESYLKKSISIEQDFIEAWLLLGDVKNDKKKYFEAIEAYEKAYSIDPGFFPGLHYILADLHFEQGNYKEAEQYLLSYKNDKELDNKTLKRIEALLKRVDFAMELVRNPLPFDPVNLGAGVNSEHKEFINSLNSEEDLLIFTRLEKISEDVHGRRFYKEAIFMASREKAAWDQVEAFRSDLENDGNIGAIAISPDGKLMVVTACDRRDGFGSCDLYFSKWIGDEWMKFKNMGDEVNSIRWDSQPTISSDGSTVYFSSKRLGGYGNADIYFTKRLKGNKWSRAQNLGKEVNSGGNEYTPSVHQDGKTMYFASDGHMGLGGTDIFIAHKDNYDNWGEIKNVGYPLNTSSDDMILIVNAEGTKGYISSDKHGGFGDFDIYSFDIPEEIKPDPVTYVKGKVLDSTNMQPLEAFLELYELNTGKLIVSTYSAVSNGEYLLIVPSDGLFALHVSKTGYVFQSKHIDQENVEITENWEENFLLNPIKQGERIVLNNIFFDFDSFVLKEESYPELDKLSSFLMENPQTRILIEGHTDNVGGMEYNQRLSQKRSDSVKNYLVGKGVETSRLESKGFGMSMPIESNVTDEGRAVNRRTEIRIL